MSQVPHFVNRECPNQVIELIEPTGPLVGFHKTGSLNQRWIFVEVGENKFTIQNVSTNTYAAPESEHEGADVVGSPIPYLWKPLYVCGKWNQIATTDGRYVWRLTSCKDYAPVVLQATPYKGKDSQWGFGN